jgi:hypothetical protein
MPCKICGGNEFKITDDKPFMQECINCGDKELWQPGKRDTCVCTGVYTCVVCTRKIAKHQGGHAIHGLPAHKKCMIVYTAWEIEQENPGISASESRILQVGRNLESLYIGTESKQ